MTDEKKKMTAQGSSVGADDGQSISQNSKTTIPDPDEKSNSPERDLEELYQKMRRMSDPAYLHTVTLDELMDDVFEGKSAVIENLLYTGAYILAGAPKIGKSFLVAQIAHHVSTGQDLWGYKTHQGTVLYLALEDDESRLQRRMFRMFGVEGTSSLHFATSAKMIGSGLDEQLEKFVREHSKIMRPAQTARIASIGPGQSLKDMPEELRVKGGYSGAYGRLDYTSIAPTITRWVFHIGSGRFAHPREVRGLTMREAARIQSFSDDFHFIGSRNDQAGQIGNAVPPYFMEQLADNIIDALQGKEAEYQQLELCLNELA